MGQQGVNNLILLHVHKERTDQLNLTNEFVMDLLMNLLWILNTDSESLVAKFQ